MASYKQSKSLTPGYGAHLYESSPLPSPPRRRNTQQLAQSSPHESFSSDKENPTSKSTLEKGKGRATMEDQDALSSRERHKRKRVLQADEDVQGSVQRRRTSEITTSIHEDKDEEELAYDPHQDIDERREIRKELRDLSKNLAENRAELLQPDSTGLIDILHEANEISRRVKQTADATIDSRLLVAAADLSYKKALALTSGSTAQGVDIDEFVSKCIAFMRQGNPADYDETQRRSSSQHARRSGQATQDASFGDEMLNWEYLGRHACMLHTSRPPIPGFLLGPLSVEKRARKIPVRREALRPNRSQETRPEVIKTADIEKSEANLADLCAMIQTRLAEMSTELMEKCNEEFHEDMTDQEEQALLNRHSIHVNGGIALFKFVVNPWSFGQTVENLFYVSFLIRDGYIGIVTDDNELPFIELKSKGVPEDGSKKIKAEVSKHQAIVELDMQKWKELIEVYNITEPMMPHRKEGDFGSAEGAKGWYA